MTGIEHNDPFTIGGDGQRGIPYQTTSHAVVLIFIVLTNIAFFAKRKAERGI